MGVASIHIVAIPQIIAKETGGIIMGPQMIMSRGMVLRITLLFSNSPFDPIQRTVSLVMAKITNTIKQNIKKQSAYSTRAC